MDWMLFLHFFGLVVSGGGVILEGTLSFIGRNSVKKTQVAIYAHNITKPLIWFGLIFILITWILTLTMEGFTRINLIKSLLLLTLICNGSFLSFYISPRLNKMKDSKELVPNRLKRMIFPSFSFAIVGWICLVGLTVWKLG